jgi:MoxR-like ATPase
MSKAKQLVEIFHSMYGDVPRTISKDEVKRVAKQNGINSLYRILNANNLAPNGEYNFPPVGKSTTTKSLGSSAKRPSVAVLEPVAAQPAQPVESKAANTPVQLQSQSVGFDDLTIAKPDPLYVPFGHFNTVYQVIKSGMFYPMYVTGLSGNGKTLMCIQSCAKAKAPVIRVNCTTETDEDDLIGGFRMINGETVFFKGPVIRAMELGAVCVLDEIDLANPAKIMCMQSILEGAGYFIKKTGEYITPKPGFNVVATANTKGKGSSDGRFIGTNVLNEAFLERFPITFEQEYASNAIERKILTKVSESLRGETDAEFINKLVDWADIIRKTFYDGGVDEVISTRRLVHIVKAHKIFGDRGEAIKMCTNRFDEETKLAFFELYTKVDENVTLEGAE